MISRALPRILRDSKGDDVVTKLSSVHSMATTIRLVGFLTLYAADKVELQRQLAPRTWYHALADIKKAGIDVDDVELRHEFYKNAAKKGLEIFA